MKELRDQSLHIGTALLALLPLVLFPNPLTGAWAGFVCGMIREVTEERNTVTWLAILNALQSRRDLTFWTLGGLLAGLGTL